MGLPFYKMIVNDDVEGMDFMGLVQSPAHMKAFVTFSDKERKKYFFREEEQIIMGVAIATDLPIYRNDPGGMGEYYVVFDKENTRLIGQKMLANGHLHNVNRQHDLGDVVENIQLDSLFYVDLERGIHPPDVFEDQKLKDGSMIICYKVHGKDNWKKIKEEVENGIITGFSIEGWFDLLGIEIKTKETKETQSTMKKLKERVLAAFDKFNEEGEPAKMAEVETTDGIVIMWDGELAEGTEVFIMDTEGNQIQAPEGAHSWMSSETMMTTIMVDGNGVVTSIEEVEQEMNENEEEEEPSEEELEKVIEEALSSVKAKHAKETEDLNTNHKTELAKKDEEIEGLKTQLSEQKTALEAEVEKVKKLESYLDDDKKRIKHAGEGSDERPYKKLLQKNAKQL